ncbi:MAG: deoxyribodipyrimidine photo-lyase [Simkaniaceae bacterium]
MAGLLWFRQDLRLKDNPALHNCAKENNKIFAAYIYAPKEQGNWEMGGAAKWWLHKSLQALEAKIKNQKGRLFVEKGKASTLLKKLCKAEKITSVYCNRCYEPFFIEQEEDVRKKLAEEGIVLKVFDGNLLIPPEKIRSKQGNIYQVYTPFWKTLRKEEIQKAAPQPRNLQFEKSILAGKTIDQLKLFPSWNLKEIPAVWAPGEDAAQNKWRYFFKNKITNYKRDRDFPAKDATSRLSPHLHFGEISPREIWHKALEEGSSSAGCFLQELAWREFSYHLLFHFPYTAQKNLKSKFSRFPWQKNKKLLTAWQKGKTGVPIVDAGMRELWQTGWMHNRVRMIVASFLIKDCLIHWLEGAKWFWDTLVDADLANNTMGWQWTAGSGADAAPFFRIFNPYTQAEKFDPEGAYIKKYLPELSQLPLKYLYDPSKAPKDVLENAGVSLGKSYPKPIIDHSAARKKTLSLFKKIKK